MKQENQEEVFFDEHEVIVSTTDMKGRILYTNNIFCQVAGYTRDEVIGEPHNILRHKDMPKAIFKYLWDNIAQGRSVNAFVKNRTKDGNYYWVRAYVAPMYENSEIVGYISYRRSIPEVVKKQIVPLYATLVEYEKTHTVEESLQLLVEYLEERGLSYEQFIDTLSLGKSISSPEALAIDTDGYYIDHVIFKTNIVRSVALGKENVEVVDSCCCAFGKKLKTLDSMPFTAHPSWSKVHYYHNHVHGLMKNYVTKADEGASEDELSSILKDVDRDTHNLLGMLNDVIDNYMEDGR